MYRFIFTEKYPNDICSLNMQGLLLERLGLFRRGKDILRHGVKLLSGNEEYRDKILLNYGRILTKAKKAEEAVEVLKNITSASFESQCVLAGAYVQNKQLAEAYSTYESALEWLAAKDSHKSHMLVAMAAVLYQHQGHEDAKTLLMQA